MDDLLTEFLTETFESLEVIDNELVRFEREPNNAQILDNVFRLVHTIKGTCGFLGLPRLETLAHAAETLMGRYRDGAEVTDAGVSTILSAIDRIKIILAGLESEGSEPAGEDDDLITPLLTLAGVVEAAEDTPASEADERDAGEPDAGEPALDAGLVEEKVIAETPASAVGTGPADDSFAEAPAEALGTLGRPLKPGEVSLEDLEAAFLAADGPEMVAPPAAAQPKPSAPAGGAPAKQAESSVANQTIRVNVNTIETLMTMVSELVLTRNQLLEISRRHEESEFNTPLQRLSNVTADLQEGVMKTRMQPIGNAWGKLPRIVRDLAHELDKPIELEMQGADTELDRQVLELIRDPLTHMVRNSADHGIEPPAERRAGGKPERGTIKVSAYHEGGHIIIAIADDGRGLNTEKLKEKALKLGLVTEAELGDMSEAQIHKLIFHPGFSTAEKVTSVSGRGVGMDVVRTNIETIGGTIDLKSVYGRGTTVTIKIPLTLAIISALIVEVAGERFAIPQLAVTELVRASAEGPTRIETLKDAEVLRLRNALLPVIRLNRLLRMEQPDDRPAKPSASAFVVVAQVGTQSFGIVVDEVFHTEEIVVKPLSGMLKDVAMFSGNTIMGDGSVIMILDPNGVAQSLGGDRRGEVQVAAAETPAVASEGEQAISLLVFEAGQDGPKAVPLSLVTRLEEFDAADVETAGERRVVQYRGKLMPLVYVDPQSMLSAEGRLALLVFAEGERVMGLVVDKILDIVEEPLKLDGQASRPGFLGNAIIAGRATEVLDVGYFLPMAFADWFARKEQGHLPTRRLLYAEDSPFFRNMIIPVLMGAGYDVVAVEDGSEALALIEAGERFDLVVTDIEMPNMDGFTLAQSLKGLPMGQHLSVVALSAFTGPSADSRAQEVGLYAFVPKFDRAGLLAVLDDLDQSASQELAA